MEQYIATLWGGGLNNSDGLTLQKRLHADIRSAILSGKIKSGVRLPATRNLAKRLGIARNTVIEAYDQLIAEGYLEAKRGAGTYVSTHTPENFLTATPQEMIIRTNNLAKIPPQPLLSGMPALDKFPKAIWARTASKAVKGLNTSLMYHSDPMGYAPLRHNIATYLQLSRSVVCTYEQIMITSGLQQGLFLLASAILAERDNIILEDPGFIGMFAAANATGRPVTYNPVDDSGTCVPTGKSGLLVTSPSQQYPLGHTMPHARRLELLSWAHATNSLILEDDYDSEFRYAGRPLNSLQGIDGGKRVIYGGTFTKSLFPAVRIGYLVLPTALIARVQALRSATDSFPAITGQLALNAFIDSGEFTKHIRRLRKTHARRQAQCIESIQNRLARYFTLQPSEAGLHLLLRPRDKLLRSKAPESAWVAAANEAGIGAVTLSHTYHEVAAEKGVLMGFANIPSNHMDNCIKAFEKNMQKETTY